MIVIIALKLIKEVGINHYIIYCDSQLVVNQFQGYFKRSNRSLRKYEEKVQLLLTVIKERQGYYKLLQVVQGENGEANSLAKMPTVEE